MAPRRTTKNESVAPKRLSARFRDKKQQAASQVGEEPSAASAKGEIHHKPASHFKGSKKEELPCINEQDASSSETLIGVESTPITTEIETEAAPSSKKNYINESGEKRT